MTLEVMIKKVNAYNEIAEVIGEYKKAVEIVHYNSCCACRLWSFKTTSYSELRKAVKAEYFDYFSKELFNCNSYKFNKDITIDGERIYITIVNA